MSSNSQTDSRSSFEPSKTISTSSKDTFGTSQSRPESPPATPPQAVKRIDLLRQEWASRIFKDVDTNVRHTVKPSNQKKVLYFWEFPFQWLGANAYFYRKGKGGPLAMAAARKPFSSEFIIYFANGNEITLKPRTYLGLWSRSYFEYNDGRYRWDGTTSLRTVDDEELVAKFDQIEDSIGQDGRLEIYNRGKDMVDVIVATLMMEIWRKHSEEN